MLVGTLAVWYGWQHEFSRLQQAILHHCTCTDEHPACPAHSMLLDQAQLNRFAFLSAYRERYIDAEQQR